MIRWTTLRLIKLTADIFPISQLAKIECVGGKVFTTNLEFSDGRTLVEEGFRKDIYEGIAQVQGIRVDYGSCQGRL